MSIITMLVMDSQAWVLFIFIKLTVVIGLLHIQLLEPCKTSQLQIC